MPIAARHRDDAPPRLEALDGLIVRRVVSATSMAALQGRIVDEMERRFAEGHRAYVAWHDGEPAGWGWVATRTASIGELASTFAVPPGERYLWNFVTLAPFRGLGIYPRLIDHIVTAESREAERFWIAYAPENHASAAGIRRAGFLTLAELSFDAKGSAAVRELTPGGGLLAAGLLGLPEAQDALAPCWRCVRAGHAVSCAAGECRCDYQRAKSGCAA